MVTNTISSPNNPYRIYEMTANIVWGKWAQKKFVNDGRYTTRWHKNVADEAKFGSKRQLFEQWLMDQGCYLEVSCGKPYIKGFDESNLTMLLLKWL